ncbi:MAG: hypothetical protein ACO24W_01085 [Candidatus Nanopelagicales bacterium]
MSALEDVVLPIRNLSVITNDKQMGSRGFIGFIAFLIACGVMANLGVQTILSQGAFTEQQLLLQTRNSAAEVQALQQQLSVMAAPATLSERARRLGMVPMENPVFLRLKDGEILGKRSGARSFVSPLGNVPTTDLTDIELTPSGSRPLHTSQIPTDDSAVLVNRANQ